MTAANRNASNTGGHRPPLHFELSPTASAGQIPASQAGDQEFALVGQLFGGVGVGLEGNVGVGGQGFATPFLHVDFLGFGEFGVVEVFHAAQVEVALARNPAEGGFAGVGAAAGGAPDPF